MERQIVNCPQCGRSRDLSIARLIPCRGTYDHQRGESLNDCGDISFLSDELKQLRLDRAEKIKTKRGNTMVQDKVVKVRKVTIKEQILEAHARGMSNAEIAADIQRTIGYVSCTVSRAKPKNVVSQVQTQKQSNKQVVK